MKGLRYKPQPTFAERRCIRDDLCLKDSTHCAVQPTTPAHAHSMLTCNLQSRAAMAALTLRKVCLVCNTADEMAKWAPSNHMMSWFRKEHGLVHVAQCTGSPVLVLMRYVSSSSSSGESMSKDVRRLLLSWHDKMEFPYIAVLRVRLDFLVAESWHARSDECGYLLSIRLPWLALAETIFDV